MYGEGVSLMVISGRIKSGGKVKMTLIIAVATVYLMFMHLRESLLLGSLTQYVTLPSFEAVRMTGNSAMTVSRIESIFSLLMLSCSLFRVLITYYVSLDALKHIFGLKSFKSLILPLAALVAMYSLKVLDSPKDNYYYGLSTTPFIWDVFTFVLPLLTLVAALIRGKRTETSVAEVSAV
jgi:spore germination protein KB